MTLLPEDVLRSPYAAMEERFDVIGIAFLCLSAILCFRDPIVAFVVNNTMATILVLLASGMITAGNSFLHYQYNPGGRLQVVALVMTLCGFVGFILLNKFMRSTPITLTVIKEDFFYLFLFSFFVVLPSIHGIVRNTVALFVWLPFMSFLALYLWRSHPTCRAGRRRGGVKTVSATYPLLSGPGVRNRAAAEGMRGEGQVVSPTDDSGKPRVCGSRNLS
ncbi:MAG: hypothetical protein SWE60_18005 [Thermodesulfobacteriota bacterium]|nr:hypothetical protein [Thermodesulfobacteriota bacterium]